MPNPSRWLNIRAALHFQHNLVPRVLWLFGQRMGASRDSGIMEKDNFFDLSSAQQWKSNRKSVSQLFMLTGNSATNFLVLEVDLKCQARIVCVFILLFQATGFELFATVFIRVNIILAVLVWEVCPRKFATTVIRR